MVAWEREKYLLLNFHSEKKKLINILPDYQIKTLNLTPKV